MESGFQMSVVQPQKSLFYYTIQSQECKPKGDEQEVELTRSGWVHCLTYYHSVIYLSILLLACHAVSSCLIGTIISLVSLIDPLWVLRKPSSFNILSFLSWFSQNRCCNNGSSHAERVDFKLICQNLFTRRQFVNRSIHWLYQIYTFSCIEDFNKILGFAS